MSIRILRGDCRKRLLEVDTGSAQTVICSPPYFNLRSYAGDQKLIWGGDSQHEHTWSLRNSWGMTGGSTPKQSTNSGSFHEVATQGYCVCGAWLGSLGNEQTPAQFIDHLVECFRPVKQVLRDDGLLFVNLGDSYSGSNGNGYKQTLHEVNRTSGGTENFDLRRSVDRQDDEEGGNLLEVPSLFALAMKQDGWILRSRIPVLKKSAMPESVNSRPTSAVEYFFMFAKSSQPQFWTHRDKNGTRVKPEPDYRWLDRRDNVEVDAEPENWQQERIHDPKREHKVCDCPKRWRRVNLWKSHSYFWDGDAIRIKSASEGRGSGNLARKENHQNGRSGFAIGIPWEDEGIGRNFRNTDLFLDSWQGLLLNEQDIPLALVAGQAGFKGAHYACVDTETEALTPNGWKHYDDLEDGQVIAAFNQDTDTLNWEPASFHKYDYDGEMVSIEKRDTSQLLTPNHKCLVQHRHGHGKTYFHDHITQAGDLKPGHQLRISADWGDDEFITIGKVFASLIGWYITEGHDLRASTPKIQITQSVAANPKHVNTIRELLSKLDADFSEYYIKHQWRGRDASWINFRIKGTIAKRLQEIAPRKQLTAELAMSLITEEAQALLDAIIDGDGSRRINIGGEERQQITQKDKNCIDAMQMLAIRLGYRAYLSPKFNGIYNLYLTKGRWLTLRSRDGKHNHIPKINYVGKVWCPSVKSGFWLARRKGKPFITGNSFNPKWIIPLVLGATSAKGACSTCGAPWSRVTEVQYKRHTKWFGDKFEGAGRHSRGNAGKAYNEPVGLITQGWRPTCGCNAQTKPQIVCDNFSGVGTVALVADQLGRDAIGIELSESYKDISTDRLINDSPLFMEIQLETMPNTNGELSPEPEDILEQYADDIEAEEASEEFEALTPEERAEIPMLDWEITEEEPVQLGLI